MHVGAFQTIFRHLEAPQDTSLAQGTSAQESKTIYMQISESCIFSTLRHPPSFVVGSNDTPRYNRQLCSRFLTSNFKFYVFLNRVQDSGKLGRDLSESSLRLKNIKGDRHLSVIYYPGLVGSERSSHSTVWNSSRSN